MSPKPGGKAYASVLARVSPPCSAPALTGKEHIYVDLAERRGGYKVCQWDVREPATLAEKKDPPLETAASLPASAPLSEPVPLPRPRPLAASAAHDVQLRASRARAQ